MKRHRIMLPLLTGFMAALLLLLAAAGSAAGAERECREAALLAAGEIGAFFAQCVPADGYSAPGTIKPEHSRPGNALGPPDVDQQAGRETWVALGNSKQPIAEPEFVTNPRQQCEGYLILAWEALGFSDGDGVDLEIFEVGTNIGSGFVEPFYVYVSEDDDEYYYVGVANSANKGAFDLFGIGPRDAVYHQIGLCDVPDGVTSSNGPDIDAAAVFFVRNEESTPAVSVTVESEGFTIGDVPLAVGESLLASAQKKIDFVYEAGEQTVGLARAGWDFYCGAESDSLFSQVVRSSILRGVVRYVAEQCPQPDLARTAVPAASVFFELERGSMELFAPGEGVGMEVQTAVVEAAAGGGSRFLVDHDPGQARTLLKALQGVLRVTPANGGLPPFDLAPGYGVVVRADSMGRPFAEARNFLPVVSGG